MKEYKINILRIFRQVGVDIIIILTIAFYGIYYFFFSDRIDEIETGKFFFLCIIFILFFNFFVGYPLFISYNHYKYDKHTKIIIDYKKQKVFYQSENFSKDFLISDITYITEYTTPILIYSNSYYKIFLKDHTTLDVTSLLIPTVDKEFKHVKQGREYDYDLRLNRRK